MGKIVVSEFISLDGVIDSPENWHFPYISDDMQESIKNDILTSDAFLYGRITYQTFMGFWPTQTNNEFGFADKINSAPKFVVTSTMDKSDWSNSSFLKGDLSEEIKKIKAQIPGRISITGSAQLIQGLMQLDLVDALWLMLHPIVVGRGKRLFKDGMDTAGFKLVNSETFDSGVIMLRYERVRE